MAKALRAPVILGWGGQNFWKLYVLDRCGYHAEVFSMAANFEGGLDILGDTIPENWGKCGRPPEKQQ